MASLTGLTGKLNGRTPVRIHFLDNSSKMFLVDSSITAGDLVKKILEKYVVKNIDDVYQNFALFESQNGSSINGALFSDDIVFDIVNAWSSNSEAKLVFMIRLFVDNITGLESKDVVARRLGVGDVDSETCGDSIPTQQYLDNAKVTDPGLLRLQYLQALYHIITGLVTCSEPKALRLGAIHFLVKFSSFQSNRHGPSFLGDRIVEFIPVRLLKKSTTTLENWEIALLDAARKLACSLGLLDVDNNSESEADGESGGGGKGDFYDEASVKLYRLYMNEVFALEQYGSTFFKINQKASRYAPDSPVIAIHSNGVIICDKSRTALKRYHIQELPSWGFKPSQHLVIEICNKENVASSANSASSAFGGGSTAGGLLEFVSTECKAMSHLLTDYAISYKKELERRSARVIEYRRSEGAGKRSTLNKSNKSGVALKTAENELAAITLQRIYRGYKLRKDWISFDAATFIQCHIRGYLARKRVNKMIERMIESGEAVIDE